jgi:phosphomannomutase / phosphoglucomutase
MLDELIFREYDIRGIYGKEIDEKGAYLIGRAFGSNLSRLNQTFTVVGYDNRKSSPILEKELIRGITESGINVLRLGLTTTPMYYFACDYLKSKSGIMITASHNPKEYNGFKFTYNAIHNAYGKDVKDLYYIIKKNNFTSGHGNIENRNVKDAYLELLTRDINLGDHKLKVVYDCGNGTTSILAKDVWSKFNNIELIPMFTESDPEFPNHTPDPLEEKNLKDLKAKVIETHADVGIAYDGDGDRVGVVDEKGNMVDIDKYMIIIWRDIYNKVSLKKGLFDVKCSKALEDELIKLNIEPVCNRTGNSYMKAASANGNFPFGGELSGHVFFRDRFPGYDDGIYASLRLIEILSHTKKTITELLYGINKYYSTKELKISVSDEKKFNVIADVKKYCDSKNYKTLTIDGVKVIFDNGFALVRASNTGPNITLRYEAKSEERLKEIEQEFSTLLDKLIKE